MLKQIKKIINIGVDEDQSFELVKRIRVVNSTSLVTVVMAITIFLYTILSGWPLQSILIITGILPSIFVPYYLNYKGHHLASRLYYLTSSYATIIAVSVLFGKESLFQYYLIGGIGMPLVFLKTEVGALKFFLSLIAILFWIALEWFFSYNSAYYALPPEIIEVLQPLNVLLVFLTVFSMFFIFTYENQQQMTKIEETTRALNDTNQELKQYTYMFTHDLKNPLNNIKILMEVIQTNHLDQLSDELREMLTSISLASQNMKGLVDSLLEYSSTGEIKYEVENFTIREIIDHIPKVLPMPPHIHIIQELIDTSISGERKKLEQVLFNLVGNAVKYHDKDKGTIIIRSMPDTHHNFIKIEVQDDGPGIEEGFIGKVFNVFEYAGPKKKDSSGIGLAIVKKLVHQAGGEVGVDSVYSKGTKFWFTWPIK